MNCISIHYSLCFFITKPMTGYFYFLNNTVIPNETTAKATPERHTPVHCSAFQAKPAQSVPRLPPTKRWNMKMVLLRLVARGV